MVPFNLFFSWRNPEQALYASPRVIAFEGLVQKWAL